MYSRWVEDRKSVHASWDAYFTNLNNGVENAVNMPPTLGGSGTFQPSSSSGVSQNDIIKQEKLAKMITSYRTRGHEIGDIDPLNVEANRLSTRHNFTRLEDNPELAGFTQAELDEPIRFYSMKSGFNSEKDMWTPREAAQRLEEQYCGKITFQYQHIPDQKVKDWIREKVEKKPQFNYSTKEKEYLLDRVLESQAFTNFCEIKYPSSKRFGIEGLDAAISGLEMLADRAKEYEVKHVVMGMAHRGRLNTLVCVFDKPYEEMFTEFHDPGIAEHIRELHRGFEGDVKYHLGASCNREYKDGFKMQMTMLPNPSHLETVNPVVVGKARCKQNFLGDTKGKTVLPVVIHGDAAFAGQGIVYECL